MVASNDGYLERFSLFLPNTSQVGYPRRAAAGVSGSANGKRSMAAICGAKSRANLECAFRDDAGGGGGRDRRRGGERSVEGK